MPVLALTSERDVETKFLQPLFTQTLGYPDNSLNFAVPVNLSFGREKKKKEADLVVSRGDKKLIVVEAKKPTNTLQSGIEQVDSYAFALQTPYSLITNGRGLILRGYYSFNSRINLLEDSVEELRKNDWKKLKDMISFANILRTISDEANAPEEVNEEKIRDYRRFFRRLHNIIRDGDKLDPAASFDELSKVLFLRAAEAEWMQKHKGAQAILTPDKVDEFARLGSVAAKKQVNTWFTEMTSKAYPDVFDEHSRINLSPDTLKNVLTAMRSFNMKSGDVDVKGRAFEEFLPSQLRGKGLGQFFTPRPVVDFMVDLAEISIHDTVVDFACGSGGFLIKAFEHMQNLVNRLPTPTWARLGLEKDEFMESLKETQLHGIDAEPRAARTAKMNMLMWGDGKNVVRGNGLDVADFHDEPYKPAEYDAADKKSGCTVILANPPFGSKEDKPEILGRYELGSAKTERKSQRTEVLFLEKGIKLLRPQGKMVIVIPEGIMSNGSDQYVRDFLHGEVEIRANISLPTHTFVQSGVQTVKTCILYVQKFTVEKKALYDKQAAGKSPDEIRHMLRMDAEFNYPVFMGSAEFLGYEPNGRPIIKEGEQTDLDALLEDFQNQELISHPDIDLLAFAKAHYDEKPLRKVDQTIRGTEKGLKTSFVVQFKDTADRLDAPYYMLRLQAGDMLASFEPLAGKVKKAGPKFRPTTDDEKDAEYLYLSVTNDGKVSLSDKIKGEEFTQSCKRVRAGDIAYNPYRVNIGSIGVVPKELDGGYISPAYVVFRVEGIDPQFLVNLMRSPFYKMYIDVLSTGSIRDSFGFELLEEMRVPNVSPEQQKTINGNLHMIDDKIQNLLGQVDEEKLEVMEQLHGLLVAKEENPQHLEDFNAVLKRSVSVPPKQRQT